MVPPGIESSLSRNLRDREACAHDFGRMIRKVPDAIARPKSVEEVANIVRWSAQNDVPLTTRGAGHSQGGQSLADQGLMLDMAWLARIQLQGQDLVRAQGGAPWGAVVDALRGTGRLPRVLTDIPEVTVGGTLSAGGFGTTSHRYGLQLGQVEQLDVVTGTGEQVRCSSSRNEALFDAVRGGQGQFGIITDAWIRLRNAGERIRQYELRYRDFDRFARDFEQVLDEGRFDRLRAETRIHDREILMSADIEYNGDHDDESVLEGLGYDEVANIRDSVEVGKAGMYPRWAFSRRMYHPWRDWLMPWEALRTVLPQPWLDPHWMPRTPGSWIGIYPIGMESLEAPLFMCPEGERLFSYSILAVLETHERANELAERLRRIDRTLIALGGKSYLSGDVGYGPKEWEEHYETKLDLGMTWKREFDPKRILRGNATPFGLL